MNAFLSSLKFHSAILAAFGFAVWTGQASDAAAISGTVVERSAERQPIPRAIVTVTGVSLPNGRSAITDDRGLFTIGQLPAGRYNLKATKPAYLQAGYGTSRPGQPGIEIVLAADRRINDVTIVMRHGSAISGLVRNPLGFPLSNTQVSALRVRPGRPLTASATTTSDDRGEYRLFGLEPGDYLVSMVPPTSTLAGTRTVEEMDAILLALRRGLASASSDPLAELAPQQAVSVAPVFYPSALTPASAQTIALGATEDRRHVDLIVRTGRTAAISGRIISNEKDDVVVTLNETSALTRPGLSGIGTQTQAGRDGSFRFTNVSPGQYAILARSGLTSIVGTPQGDRRSMWGRLELTVSGDDVANLNVVLQPTVDVSGRIVLDGATAPLAPDFRNLRVGLAAMDQLAPPALVPVSADGTFSVLNLVPGSFTVVGSDTSSRWWMRSATISEHDAVDTPVELAESTGSALITFTNRATSLSGLVQGGSTVAGSNLFIVMFPMDPSLRKPNSRRLRIVRPDSDSRYTITQLAPGDYFVGAISDFDPDDVWDSTFFDTIAAVAVSVPIIEGAQKIQDLRVVSAISAALRRERPLR